MPAGIVTNGVILRALGGNIRTLKTCRPHSLPFRFLLVAAGALMLMAALAPSANAQSLIAYYNFEDGFRGGPPDYTAEPIAFVQASMVPAARVLTSFPAFAREAPGLTQNVWPTDPDLPRFGLGLSSRTSDHNNAAFDIPLFSSQGLFQNMTISFAISGLQNDGFNQREHKVEHRWRSNIRHISRHTAIPHGPEPIVLSATRSLALLTTSQTSSCELKLHMVDSQMATIFRT